MTEQEYIDSTDYQKIRDILAIMHDILPSISTVIDVEGYRKILIILKKWRDKYKFIIEEE